MRAGSDRCSGNCGGGLEWLGATIGRCIEGSAKTIGHAGEVPAQFVLMKKPGVEAIVLGVDKPGLVLCLLTSVATQVSDAALAESGLLTGTLIHFLPACEA